MAELLEVGFTSAVVLASYGHGDKLLAAIAAELGAEVVDGDEGDVGFSGGEC
jgi:spore coat polysaccharide biosynthesis protein SpsF (cytidylyltransferase family)